MDRMTAMNVFVEVAERGSLTAAAEALEMSRAMVTRYLAEVERWLGARLLHRTTRRISLTGPGEAALLRFRQMLAIGDELRAELATDNPSRTGCCGSPRVSPSGRSTWRRRWRRSSNGIRSRAWNCCWWIGW